MELASEEPVELGKHAVMHVPGLALGTSQKLTHSARYPSPLKAKLLCPLGKLLHPSCKM